MTITTSPVGFLKEARRPCVGLDFSEAFQGESGDELVGADDANPEMGGDLGRVERFVDGTPIGLAVRAAILSPPK